MVTDELDWRGVENALRTRYMGRVIIYRERTTSTMIDAAAAGRDGAPEGTVVVAEEQSAGRGRLRRTWISPRGGSLLISIILRPTLERLQKISIAAAVALARSVERTTGLPAAVKWPNDVFVEGKKVAGILIESHLRGAEVECAVVGVGVNVNFDPRINAEIAQTATSLSLAIGRPMSREALLAAFLQAFEECYEAVDQDDRIRQEWADRMLYLGETVTATFGSLVEEGVAEGVDEDGALLLRRSDGTTAHIAAGDVTLRRA